MQWMNQSGTLKITHRARVKFSVNDYVDFVDCDMTPLSVCHLLLGQHGSMILMMVLMKVVPIIMCLCIKVCLMC
jgi:hypothetical protein